MCNEDFEVFIMPFEPLPTSPHPKEMYDDSENQKAAVKIVSGNPVELTAKLTPCTIEGNDISQYHIPMDSWTIPEEAEE